MKNVRATGEDFPKNMDKYGVFVQKVFFAFLPAWFDRIASVNRGKTEKAPDKIDTAGV